MQKKCKKKILYNVIHSADTKAKKLSSSRCLSTDYNQATCKYRTANATGATKWVMLVTGKQAQTGFAAKGQQIGEQHKGNIRRVTDNPSDHSHGYKGVT